MSKDVKYNVLIAAPAWTEEQVEVLEKGNCKVKILKDPIPERLDDEIAGADGICLGIIDMPSDLLVKGKNLKVIARQGSGTDMVDLEVAAKLGIWVTNTPGANANAVAEFTLGALLCVSRHIARSDRHVKNGGWRDPGFFGPELNGRTVALFGLGKIGQRVARMCLSFGMTVRAYDPYLPDEVFRKLRVEQTGSLLDAVKAADALLIHAAPSPNTIGSVNKNIMDALNPGSVIVNVARAEFLNEQALLDSLESGQIAGAALDVFTKEPPVKRALAEHSKVIATPHTAAWSYEARTRMTVGAAEEVIRCLRGEKPNWPVNQPIVPRNGYEPVYDY